MGCSWTLLWMPSEILQARHTLCTDRLPHFAFANLAKLLCKHLDWKVLFAEMLKYLRHVLSWDKASHHRGKGAPSLGTHYRQSGEQNPWEEARLVTGDCKLLKCAFAASPASHTHWDPRCKANLVMHLSCSLPTPQTPHWTNFTWPVPPSGLC